MRADPPAQIAERYPPGSLAERAWWTRVERAAEREGLIGRKGVMSDWCHASLKILSAGETRLELVGPFGQRRWAPIPPERCSEEYKRAETRQLNDELGVRLGVGPMPGPMP